jgi:hypothetical protein
MFRFRNHNPVLSSFMTYHRICNKSNTTGATYVAGTAYSLGPSVFVPFFNCPSGVRIVHVVKLHVFTFLVPVCDVYDLKTMFDSS